MLRVVIFLFSRSSGDKQNVFSSTSSFPLDLVAMILLLTVVQNLGPKNSGRVKMARKKGFLMVKKY